MAFHFDQAKQWAGVDGFFPAEYFLEIARDCMGFRGKTHQYWGTKRYIDENVDSVHFVSSAVYVKKKKTLVPSFDIESATQYARNRGVYPDGLLRYVKIEPGDKTIEYYKTLAELKKNSGDMDEALTTLLEGVNVYPESWDLISCRGEYQNQNGDYESAIHSFEKALTLCTQRNFSLTIDRFLTEVRKLHAISDKAKSASSDPEGILWRASSSSPN